MTAARRARVLIVDGARMTRRLLARMVAADPALALAGTATDGLTALAQLSDTAPDLVVLDLDLPRPDGIHALQELRRHAPGVPVVVWSTHAGPGPRTRDALLLGAVALVRKPSPLDSPAGAAAVLRRELLPALHACASVPALRSRPAPAGPAVALPLRSGGWRPAEGVVIGASAGGPESLGKLLAALPPGYAAPVMVALHMPGHAIAGLARHLGSLTPLRVAEAVPGEAVSPGRVFLAPGDRHLIVRRCRADIVVDTHLGPPRHSCRPSVDVLFHSAAGVWGAAALGVVLTGMGRDGLAGARCIREAGGRVFVQDAASSLVWGMGRAVAEAGLATRQGSPGDLAAAIAGAARTHHRPGIWRRGSPAAPDRLEYADALA